MKSTNTKKYNIDYFVQLAKKNKNQKTLISVCPYEDYFLKAINFSYKLQIIKNIILVGDIKKIKKYLLRANINMTNDWQLIDSNNDIEAANKAMQLAKENKNAFLMKGVIDTSVFLKSFLNKEYCLRTKNLLSHCCLSYHPDYQNFYLISDAAIIIKPTLEQKVEIIKNAISLANSLGIKNKYVANLTAKEKVYDKMPSTEIAFELQKIFKKKKIKNCYVSGPLQIDLAINLNSKKIKDNNDPVAGKANILICPDIESANILTKGLVYLGGWSFVGIVLGAKIPVILNSRSTNEKDLIVAICLATIYKK